MREVEWETLKLCETQDRKVWLELLRARDLGKFKYAARLRLLGLTAYGTTEEEAIEKLCEMTGSFIRANFKLKGGE